MAEHPPDLIFLEKSKSTDSWILRGPDLPIGLEERMLKTAFGIREGYSGGYFQDGHIRSTYPGGIGSGGDYSLGEQLAEADPNRISVGKYKEAVHAAIYMIAKLIEYDNKLIEMGWKRGYVTGPDAMSLAGQTVSLQEHLRIKELPNFEISDPTNWDNLTDEQVEYCLGLGIIQKFVEMDPTKDTSMNAFIQYSREGMEDTIDIKLNLNRTMEYVKGKDLPKPSERRKHLLGASGYGHNVLEAVVKFGRAGVAVYTNPSIEHSVLDFSLKILPTGRSITYPGQI